jgi:hypothetical protein
MNPLVKKEIRLLLPSWSVAMLLALVQVMAQPYNFYIEYLLFFGLTIMALTTFGRETSLNTFSSLLAQPAERRRIWQTKLSVLAIAFLTVFALWLVCFFISGLRGFQTNDYDSRNLFITICLIATATFTGGLWTTLLLRQIAGAFWLTLLVPVVLFGISATSLAHNEANGTFIAVLCVVFAVYSIGGFLLARRLFFRAQDVGWSGGVISLPEWKFFALRSVNASSARNRKPFFALLKKEFQLQQVCLFGAAGLLVLHIGVIVLRKYHPFVKDSAGEEATSIFWLLWLILAPMIGSMAVAEERRLGVMEGQFCQPVSRRLQFALKGTVALLLGILLCGILPMLLENIAAGLGAPNPMFPLKSEMEYAVLFQSAVVVLAAVLTGVNFFASTLSRSFLQAVGLGIATSVISIMLLDISEQQMVQGFISVHSALPAIIGVPIFIITLLWLAYLNFINFHPGWPLWRRNLLGFAGAFACVIVASIALFHRAWEVFEPAEPPHGPAKFSLANPPVLSWDNFDNLLVRRPDGCVWFDYLDEKTSGNKLPVIWLLRLLLDPLPKSAGAQRFVAGSNWVSVSARHVDFWSDNKKGITQTNNHVFGYLDTVGVKADGTLWLSEVSTNGRWTGDKMNRFGDGTNWQQLVRAHYEVLLLKNDGTLWLWGTNHLDWNQRQTHWPSLHSCQPYQVGTNSDWKEIDGALWRNLARKSDRSVWVAGMDYTRGEDKLHRETSMDQVALPTLSSTGSSDMADVRPDGTLWVRWQYQTHGTNADTGFVRAGMETNWAAVALTWRRMVALKSDGSLWEWNYDHDELPRFAQKPPTRLGRQNDWVAIDHTWNDTLALAADGSLWLWPDREFYEQYSLLKLPKQPQLLGNVFGRPN